MQKAFTLKCLNRNWLKIGTKGWKRQFCTIGSAAELYINKVFIHFLNFEIQKIFIKEINIISQ